MGGNALKEYGVERLNKEEFLELRHLIEHNLRQSGFVNDRDYYFIEAYEDKEDFGDMDILINKRAGEGYNDLMSFIDGREMVSNGSCHSVLYKHRGKSFQVDFILEKDKNFDFASHYFDFNDLGNLIGRVAHKAGFKFGHDGLWYVVRDGDYKVGDICLTKDFYEAIDFLGFDVERYKQGFDSLEDIFEFVISNRAYDPTSYDLANRSRYARIRDVKRPTYQKFIKWTQEKEIPPGPDITDKEGWKSRALKRFPNYFTELVELKSKLITRKLVRRKFNGKLVMELTGLQGKELGEFIRDFKADFNDFDKWVLNTPQNEVIEIIKGA